MKDNQVEKVQRAKQFLESKGFMVKELSNGQLQVDKKNYWATTEKWHDPSENKKGVGINSFLQHLRSLGYDA